MHEFARLPCAHDDVIHRPRKLMRRLVFGGGVLVSIESLGYGYRET